MCCSPASEDGAKTTLVVCPLSLIPHWQQQVKEFAPSLKCHVYHGGSRGNKALSGFDLVLTTFQTLASEHGVWTLCEGRGATASRRVRTARSAGFTAPADGWTAREQGSPGTARPAMWLAPGGGGGRARSLYATPPPPGF